MPQHSNRRSPRRRRQKGHEKILEEIIVENFPKIATQVQETQRVPNRINLRCKTHINQINKDQTQRTNIKKQQGKNNKLHTRGFL